MWTFDQKIRLSLMALLVCISAPALAQDDIEPVTVRATRTGDLTAIPGAATIVPKSQISQSVAVSGEDVLKMVPGLTVMSEDGAGLRLNVGMRGLDPERSRNVLILEDGVPVTAGPYSSPGMYYNTPIYMIESLDVIKGSGSILYGPQTIGGVINYKTIDFSEALGIKLDAVVGSQGLFRATATLGNQTGGQSYLLQISHQRFDGARNLGMDATSVLGKMRIWLDARTWFELKLHLYDEFSRASYLGLTTAQYKNDPSANHAIYDRFAVRRYAAHVSHNMLLGDAYDKILLKTTVYGQILERNWKRQDFDRQDGGTDTIDKKDASGKRYERIITGENKQGMASNDGSGIFFKNSTGNRNRRFEFAGIESRLAFEWDYDRDIKNEAILGVRLHSERATIQRINGTHGGASSGVIRDDERLGGQAMSLFMLNQFKLFYNTLRVTPGLRYELANVSRKVLRRRVEGVPTDIYSPIQEHNLVHGLIPGIGIDYDLFDALTFFTGIHRGFSPPRAQDAITSEGESLTLEAEYSVNYELGLRMLGGDFFFIEMAGFIMDFSNQVIEPTEASGAVGSTLINGGETTHIGLELGTVFDLAQMFDFDDIDEMEGIGMTLAFNYTLTSATFGDGWNENLKGNDLPYAPTNVLSAQFVFEGFEGFQASIAGLYVGQQFTDKENTVEASPDGLRGALDARFTLDAKVAYQYEDMVKVYISGKNLTNQIYIASRRPQGIRAGGFLQVMAGVEFMPMSLFN